MTLRTRLQAIRPRVQRAGQRDPADAGDRFQFWVTLGFVAVIVLTIGIVLAAIGFNYYDAHLRPVASVEGTQITRDDWAERARLTLYRIDRAKGRLREAVAAGQIDESTYEARFQGLTQAEQGAESQAIEDLIDLHLQERLARDEGVAISDEEVQAAIGRESSTPERRRIEVVFVEPEAADADLGATPEEDEAARERAEQALAELEDGVPFAQVAEQYSTDASRDNGGDYGIVTAENPTDPAFVDAVFEADQGEVTDIVKGEDGTYRFARVTEVIQGASDPTFMPRLTERLPLDTYREQIRLEEIAEKLREHVTEQAVSGPVQQYHVAEIHLEGVPVEDETEADEGQIRAAHVLYSPGDDPAGAGDLPDDDPEWEEAEEAARAAYDALSAIDDVEERKEAFAARAEAESDDQGSGATGGDLGWFTRGDMVAAFADPLFDGEDLVSGDILEPVKSDFGWHVILFEDRRAPVDDRLADVQERLAAGDPFADVAREYSDGDEAADGGALGWLIAEQLPGEAEGVIQELDPGEVSEPLFVDDDGYHIYQLIEEAERELNAEQRSLLRGGAYDTWYTERKEQAEADGRITRDESIFGGGSVVDPAEGVEAPEDAVP